MTAKIESLIKCDGKGCSMRNECGRMDASDKKLKLKTKNCIGLGFDLFIKKQLKPTAKYFKRVGSIL